MPFDDSRFASAFYAHFKIFHELMSVKIREILLVSSPYDAFIMEEDGSLASRIINEYSGLNLSHPPRVTRTASAFKALEMLYNKKFDLVITMPHVDEMDGFSLGLEIKNIRPDLPVILLAHTTKGIYPPIKSRDTSGIDKIFIWSGNSDLLLALVKNTEDQLNVRSDTEQAMVRVLILVEDSPVYYSSFLPLIYKEIVHQTQVVLGEGLNEEHRLLRMRARPKILLAANYEEAIRLCRKYHDYLFGIISDARFPRRGQMDDHAGFMLLSQMRKEIFDLPLLMMSSDPENREKAAQIPAVFLDKNSPSLLNELHNFFLEHLGFGDFVFRKPDNSEIDRASSLRMLQEKIARVPDDCLCFHAERNHFSNWIMARSEIGLASHFREVDACEFGCPGEIREYLISNIRALRKMRQKGVVAQFRADTFDAAIMDFVKIGTGSLGGKARGLAFMSAMLHNNSKLHESYPAFNIQIPKTLVITTQGFEEFVAQNQLGYLANQELSDAQVRERFLQAEFPDWLASDLKVFLRQVDYPLSVRSSSLLEDAQFQPYAGLYETYMIPNNHPDLNVRLKQLIAAIKRVYASTYYQGPKAFAKNTSNQPQEEAMAVIIQLLTGEQYHDYFYPALSGVALSRNFYPVSPMKAEDGIAHIALGLGRTVVEGERALRFSPKYPSVLPQFSTVDDMLENSQRFFYALKVRDYPESLQFDRYSNLEKREIDDAEAEFPVKALCSTYIPEEHRIRDTGHIPGPKVLTFAQLLKFKTLPLPDLLYDLLSLGRKGMGCPVEIEFSMDLSENGKKGAFYFLQMRPMAGDDERFEVEIRPEDIQKAFCRSEQALGNGKTTDIADIVYVKPEDFRLDSTVRIAEEIDKLNAGLHRQERPYLLIGPGRWGSSDRWLGIPVQWRNISGVKAIVEMRNDILKADPSQGSHFFQNLTSLGIHYLTVNEGSDHFDWAWIRSLPVIQETKFLRHVRAPRPLLLKIDGRQSRAVMRPGD